MGLKDLLLGKGKENKQDKPETTSSKAAVNKASLEQRVGTRVPTKPSRSSPEVSPLDSPQNSGTLYFTWYRLVDTHHRGELKGDRLKGAHITDFRRQFMLDYIGESGFSRRRGVVESLNPLLIALGRESYDKDGPYNRLEAQITGLEASRYLKVGLPVTVLYSHDEPIAVELLTKNLGYIIEAYRGSDDSPAEADGPGNLNLVIDFGDHRYRVMYDEEEVPGLLNRMGVKRASELFSQSITAYRGNKGRVVDVSPPIDG